DVLERSQAGTDDRDPDHRQSDQHDPAHDYVDVDELPDRAVDVAEVYSHDERVPLTGRPEGTQTLVGDLPGDDPPVVRPGHGGHVYQPAPVWGKTGGRARGVRGRGKAGPPPPPRAPWPRFGARGTGREDVTRMRAVGGVELVVVRVEQGGHRRAGPPELIVAEQGDARDADHRERDHDKGKNGRDQLDPQRDAAGQLPEGLPVAGR